MAHWLFKSEPDVFGWSHQVAKGDAGEFNRLLKTVPEDLRKETLATALEDLITARVDKMSRQVSGAA